MNKGALLLKTVRDTAPQRCSFSEDWSNLLCFPNRLFGALLDAQPRDALLLPAQGRQVFAARVGDMSLEWGAMWPSDKHPKSDSPHQCREVRGSGMMSTSPQLRLPSAFPSLQKSSSSSDGQWLTAGERWALLIKVCWTILIPVPCG